LTHRRERCGPTPSTGPHRAARYKRYLAQILDLLVSADPPYAIAHQEAKPKIILLTPPPICPTHPVDSDRAGQVDQDAVKKYAQAVTEIYGDWNHKGQVALVNCWDAIFDAGGDDPNQLEALFV
jgi:hypothetical protein